MLRTLVSSAIISASSSDFSALSSRTRSSYANRKAAGSGGRDGWFLVKVFSAS